MKNHVLVIIEGAIGTLGGLVATLWGGWDMGLRTLVIMMIIDYITGLLVAGVFKKSSKSQSGALESRAGWKGLCRKGATLIVVLVAHQIDVMICTTWVRDAVVISYLINEIISVTENVGLMGVPIPKKLIQAIDILKRKTDEEKDKDEKQKDAKKEDEKKEDDEE